MTTLVYTYPIRVGFAIVCRRQRLIPLSQVDQYLGLLGGIRDGGCVRLFRKILIGLPACRSLSCGAAARAGLSARLCGDCRARRYPVTRRVMVRGEPEHGLKRDVPVEPPIVSEDK